ncbi:hypothetical protein DAPPUDRAFT_320951 [Daphnia pulex]|uniref:Uncharacterized protein n=1 Tax=Daphnia pulex TaxID=6669 RepID=E9GRJ2_DAPPU|nr:hypothetical protein DAPPUDRAFT_320951 [Daphnia pulex]|eukprot:EFX77906.1 hypothetical protein DAPPUDRAFT_320951 [Daphnia pulex]
MVIRVLDLSMATAITENGYYQRRIGDALRFLATNPSLVLQCNAHRTKQKSLKNINRTYTNVTECEFNNSVEHNPWLFVSEPPIYLFLAGVVEECS